MKLCKIKYLSILFLFSILSFAEVIKLKNGKSIEAKILHKDEDKIKLDMNGITLTYYLDEIESIDGKKIEVKKQPAATIEKDTKFIFEISGEGYDFTKESFDEIEQQILLVYKFYKNFLKFNFPERIIAKVKIFGNDEIFAKYQKEKLGKILSRWGGVYSSSQYFDEILCLAKINKHEMFKFIRHETSHFLLRYIIEEPAVLIDEGLATFFENAVSTDDELKIFFPNTQDAMHLKYKIKHEKDFDLKNYFEITLEGFIAFNKRTGNLGYTIAFYIVSFFMSDPKHFQIFRDILYYIKDARQPSEKIIQIIEQFYPGGFNQFDQDWREWVLKEKKELTFKIKK